MKTLLTAGLTLAATAALATPAMMKDFKTLSPPPAGSALATANCKSCHTTGAALNAFGVDVQKGMKAVKAKTVTADAMKKFAALDSDKDGVTNAAECKKGTLPGDPKSK